MRYRQQLDSLRALAALAVLMYHFAGWGEGLPPWLEPWYPSAYWGVRLFFVISGFLITGILLDARTEVEQLGVGRGLPLRRFYGRRFLRIFPVYYATLAAAAILGFGSVRVELPWHALYGSNFLFARNGVWSDSVNHFWSLAVEEQFYVLWPLCILFIPRKALVPFMAAAAAIGPAFRLWAGAEGWNEISRQVLLPACVDHLAVGGLLAWAQRSHETVAKGQRWRACLAGGVLLVAAVSYPPVATHLPLARMALYDTGLALLFVWVVEGAARGFGGPVGWLLDRRSLRYLGTISYGVYLFHLFAPRGFDLLGRRLHIPFPSGGPLRLVLLCGATVAAASLSWHLFEKPINDLKSRLPYVGNTKSQEPTKELAAEGAREV